ncbi:50S ribosomal protein L25/general stress protein Ctc [Frankia sp. CNm7]|uniref:Large ribosomal subunit protein bL25 n=1 Tax=Frankia nepalensis TaxID=1836974 RepID=A0A937UWJ4_9ACTN|nr:50S ribosomal protein L25/general stress protein Ctc [Frankia nepalensis]MBL7495987.1 50S ribosomal protein L25/general stress protein Ctc [Frankia nepalensis]MBL7513318.1 50S ribosomal protein L25/general stress protein Ctc [Frankia nepalensis]MBL7523618.1 50S ribosomal protein L25/general stress protein Ctc [Frankia nepalensis]MBL7633466.1 50S ribosomal protein L25/general stress protein Ctc [Frankia nepalensis]
MSEVRIVAEPRTEFGKGGARRTRRAGKVPAVLYGHGQPPRHVALSHRELLHAFKTDAGTNVLLTLDLGDGTELALPKDVQRHPIKGTFEHVDLVLVRRGEKVTVDVPVTIVGEAHPDAIVDQQHTTVSVSAPATSIPDSLELSVAGLEPGSSISAGQLALPRGVALETDAEAVVVQALLKPTAAQMEADLGETAEGQTVEAASAEAAS